MRWILVVLVVLGCSKRKDAPRPVEKTPETKAEVAPKPVKKIDGPSVSPVTTRSVAFVVPSETANWWGEMNFSCYRAAMSLTGTRTAGEAFEKLSPTVPSAMASAGIDLGRDMAAIGGFDCGGTPCLYVAAALAQPEKMPDVLAKLLPGTPQKTVAPGHYTIDTKGMTGTRTIHIRVVPIQWSAVPDGDAWNTEAGRATHIVFIVGVDGKNLDIDPVAKLADAAKAAEIVKDVEGVLGDNHARCILGRVGATDFQPGFKLERARFALAAPSGQGDALMKMIGSQRTVELVVEMVLSPAAKDSNVKGWIQKGRTAVAASAAPVRMQFAGNPILDVFIDMIAILADRGFKYEVKDKAVRFTWRTDRVPASEMAEIEKRYQAVAPQ
jgi:hypothetical protein